MVVPPETKELGLLSWLELPTGIKEGFFGPGWWLQSGQKVLPPPRARLAVGSGTKVFIGPESNDSWDKYED